MKIILIILVVIALCMLFVYVYNARLFTTNAVEPAERIIFVTGSYTEPKYLDAWDSYLQTQFPDNEVVVFRSYYPYKPIPEATPKLISVRDDLIELLSQQSDTPTRVITYSYGAVLLSAALKQIQDADMSVNIIKTVTVAGSIGPDTAFGDADFLQSRIEIGYDFENKLPSHTSVCGYFDSLVSCKRATYVGENSVKTFSNHYAYVVPQLFAGRTIIAELIREPND